MYFVSLKNIQKSDNVIILYCKIKYKVTAPVIEMTKLIGVRGLSKRS